VPYEVAGELRQAALDAARTYAIDVYGQAFAGRCRRAYVHSPVGLDNLTSDDYSRLRDWAQGNDADLR